MLTLLKQVFWPPLAPIDPRVSRSSRTYWRVICAVSVIPLTAILHHTILYPHTCILDPFGSDYTLEVTLEWLSRDPSLPWAIILMMLAYHLGDRIQKLKFLVAPAFVSFLPASLWVWDIPFTERTICRHFHGHKLMLLEGVPLTRRYFYLFGLVVYLAFILFISVKRKKDNPRGSETS